MLRKLVVYAWAILTLAGLGLTLTYAVAQPMTDGVRAADSIGMDSTVDVQLAIVLGTFVLASAGIGVQVRNLLRQQEANATALRDQAKELVELAVEQVRLSDHAADKGIHRFAVEVMSPENCRFTRDTCRRALTERLVRIETKLDHLAEK